MLDVSRIPLTDVHCHPLSTDYAGVSQVVELQGLVALGATGTAPYPAFDVEHGFFWQYLVRPEVYWIGAIAGRQAVSEAMSWACDAGILDEPTAQRAAAMILDENARRIYGIPS